MRRRLLLVLPVAVAALAVLVVFILNIAPETSEVVLTEAQCVSVSEGEACLRYPTMTGQNLPGTDFTLPADFEGNYILVLTPFDREQQILADTWLPIARELAETYAGFTYYNVPVFPNLAAPIRLVSRTGLTALISDERVRKVTITVFLEDRDAFLAALEIPDVEQIRVYLLNSDGEVLWQSSGEFSAEQGENLRLELERLGVPAA